MPVDFSATPRGNTALKRESKSATELVGSMLNVFKSKVRSHAPTAPPPASPLHPSRHRNAHHLGLERCPAQSRVPCALDDPRPPRPVRPRRALSHPTYWSARPRAAAVAPLDGRRRLGQGGGLAHRGLRRRRGPPGHARPVLRGRLVHRAVHVPRGQQAGVHPLLLARLQVEPGRKGRGRAPHQDQGRRARRHRDACARGAGPGAVALRAPLQGAHGRARGRQGLGLRRLRGRLLRPRRRLALPCQGHRQG